MTSKWIKLNILTVGLCLAVITGAQAQTPKPPPTAKVPKGELPTVVAPAPPAPYGAFRGDGVTTERALPVDADVNVKLCVLEGRLKINGWERDEMRVFVSNGTRFGMKVLEKSATTSKPNWVLISRTESGRGQMSECLAGESIEIDLPTGAGLTVTGRATHTTVDSVKKISIKNVEGNIALRNITGGIFASTYQGDVTVENSAGSISLESSTGNIIAYEVSPGQIGDLLRVKTNSGAISLQRLEHRQIEANSITGSVLFDGKFLSGGLYNFKTSNGSIRLLIPDKSSCTVQAFYGFGMFNSDFPLKVVTETVTSGGKSFIATLGTGDATVKLTTSSGVIGIKKQ